MTTQARCIRMEVAEDGMVVRLIETYNTKTWEIGYRLDVLQPDGTHTHKRFTWLEDAQEQVDWWAQTIKDLHEFEYTCRTK